MALVRCPDCGRDISDAASACIGCGRPMQFAALQVQSRASKEITVLKTLGTLGCLAGFVVSGLGILESSTNEIGIGATVFMAGFVAFLIGRLQQ
jgi:hypothetical protein